MFVMFNDSFLYISHVLKIKGDAIFYPFQFSSHLFLFGWPGMLW